MKVTVDCTITWWWMKPKLDPSLSKICLRIPKVITAGNSKGESRKLLLSQHSDFPY